MPTELSKRSDKNAGLAAAHSTSSNPTSPSPRVAARRNTGAPPTPWVSRSAIARATSCSSGKNRPGPTVYTATQSTDSVENASVDSARAAMARKRYDDTPSTMSPPPTATVPLGKASFNAAVRPRRSASGAGCGAMQRLAVGERGQQAGIASGAQARCLGVLGRQDRFDVERPLDAELPVERIETVLAIGHVRRGTQIGDGRVVGQRAERVTEALAQVHGAAVRFIEAHGFPLTERR